MAALPLKNARIATSLVLVVFCTVMLIFAFFFEISGAVIVNGSVKVLKNKVILQHPEGGKVQSVFVTEGQSVKIGTPIIELANPVLRSNFRSLQLKIFSERVRTFRLQSEARYPQVFDAAAIPVADIDQRMILQSESQLYLSKRRNLEAQLGSLSEQVTFLKNEIAGLRLAVKNDGLIAAKNEELVKQGFLSSTAVINQEQLALSRQIELERAQQRLAELQLRSSALIQDFQNAASAELRSTSDRVLEIEEKIKPASESIANLIVVAPADGTIVNLTRLGSGSVLGPKETIAEIVPSERALILEANLPTDQVAHVQPGMPARVTIQQLKKLLGKELSGRVLTVSADSLSQAALGTWTYLVRIEIENVSDEDSGLLRPGMPAEIHIQTSSRTIADYLLSPIKAYMNRALREPN